MSLIANGRTGGIYTQQTISQRNRKENAGHYRGRGGEGGHYFSGHRVSDLQDEKNFEACFTITEY